METLLDAEGLRRRLADGRVLLDAVSLGISGGDRVGIAGPAGSGKTLLLRAIVGLDPIDDGNVFWRGQHVRDAGIPDFRRRVAYLAQVPFMAEGTVETNLRIPFGFAAHRARPFDRQVCVDLLGRMGRGAAFLEQSVESLSGGERQVVALVRLLQLRPRVLLLDEPTAALDPETCARAEALVIAWALDDTAGRAFVWVSHDTRQIARVTARQCRMDRGALVEVTEDKDSLP